MQKIILIGAPGSGKGTQGELLASRLGFKKISTGDLLREEIKNKSEMGLKVKAIIDRGDLVPDDIMEGLLKSALTAHNGARLYFDGYPRNLEQAACLDKVLGAEGVSGVFYLKIEDEVLISRLSGRRVCSECQRIYHVSTDKPRMAGKCDDCGVALMQRPDDREESVKHRLQVYARETAPVLEHYDAKKLLHTIQADDKKENVYSALEKLVRK